ncbi:MAG: response regulator transcription factor [Fusobacteriota bacterium]
MKALVVEDHDSLKTLLKVILESKGIKTDGVENGTEFFKKVNRKKYDIIILDINLPDIDGITLCEILNSNKKKYNNPIIFMLTAETDQDKINETLKLGVSDYITKPFDKNEFVLRLFNHIRIRKEAKESLNNDNSKSNDKKITYKDLVLYPHQHTLVKGHETIDMTSIEYKILHLLIKNKSQVLTRQSILQEVWGSDKLNITDRVVDVNICRLKKKIESLNKDLSTVWGIGYTLKT